MLPELPLQGKTSTGQSLEASYSLDLWEGGQERGLTVPVASDRFGILLCIWEPGRSRLAGFKDIGLSMTPRCVKGIPEHSV